MTPTYSYPEHLLASETPLSDRFFLAFDLLLSVVFGVMPANVAAIVLSIIGFPFVAVLIGAGIVWGAISAYVFLRIRKNTRPA